MKKLIIVLTVFIFILPLEYMSFAEDIVTLKTIVPDQETTRAKRGVVGNPPGGTWTGGYTYSDLPDANIGGDNLIVGGQVGIGTTTPTEALTVSGNIDLNNNLIKNAKVTTWFYTASNTVLANDENDFTTLSNSFVKVYTITVPYQAIRSLSTFRIYFELGCAIWTDNARARIYRNGAYIEGTEVTSVSYYWEDNQITMDIAGWSPGDTIELWLRRTHGTGSAAVNMLRVKGDINWQTVNLVDAAAPTW